jgi:hypothetical protein
MNINYQKLKSEMDSDGDFIVDQIISADDDEPFEEILLLRSGDESDEYYRVTVEKHTNGEDDYTVINEFGSELEDIQDAVKCFLDNGGNIETFSFYS